MREQVIFSIHCLAYYVFQLYTKVRLTAVIFVCTLVTLSPNRLYKYHKNEKELQIYLVFFQVNFLYNFPFQKYYAKQSAQP